MISSVQSLSHVQLFVTPWTKQSLEFSNPEYWSEQSLPSPADLPDPEIEPRFPALQGDSLPSEPSGKPHLSNYVSLNKLYDFSSVQSLSHVRLFATP